MTWILHRNKYGYADSIDLDGQAILHLQPGTEFNEKNAGPLVRLLNEYLTLDVVEEKRLRCFLMEE